MSHPTWPLFDLGVTVEGLSLDPLREADLAEVADRLPDDIELDPAATRFAGLDEPAQRAVVVRQAYWRSMGTWTTTAWRLTFVVRRDAEILGVQELEGNDFPTLRTVDTSSHLIPAQRGRGVGQQMRRAVLGLAFDHLGAEAAITSAWSDNAASLGVSRALGYQPNGAHRQRRGSGVDTMVHLRLPRDAWLGAGRGAGVEIVGLEPCLPFFGLDRERLPLREQ
jgi:RimJ/RimL family protein N-acetyltransferase